LNSSGPFSHDVLCCQIQGFEQDFVIGENAFAFSHFSQLAVVTLDHIRGVDNYPDLRRILEKG
jgi:hypothetical protein